jgi:uncharacterized protein YcbX
MTAATVASLFVYPVKSCRGIALERADVLSTGLGSNGLRDREWMVVDRRGRFVTQRERPRLALVDVRPADDGIELQGPGLAPIVARTGSASREVVVWSAHVAGFDAGDDVADALSRYLDDEVRLVRFDERRPRPCNPVYAGDSGATTLFADGYPLLVVGRASLDDLNRRLDGQRGGGLPINRFRPNLVLDGLDPYDEDHVDTLAIGGVVLKLVKPCTRCEITTTDQATGRRGIQPLRTLSTYRRDDRLAGVTFGMNAIVAAGAGASIGTGDRAEVTLRF